MNRFSEMTYMSERGKEYIKDDIKDDIKENVKVYKRDCDKYDIREYNKDIMKNKREYIYSLLK